MEKNQWHLVNSQSLAKLSGAPIADIKKIVGKKTLDRLKKKNLNASQTSEVLANVVNEIVEKQLRVAGKPEDNKIWEKGWGEVADRMSEKKFHPDLLIPQYFGVKEMSVLRYDGAYVQVPNLRFMYELDQAIRRIVFKTYLKGSKRILDIGCGTGHSQLMLAGLFPDAELAASDWTNASSKTVAKIAEYVKKPIEWSRFDMLTLEGKENLRIDGETTVMTVHSMEQLGSRFKAFADHLVAKKPKLVVHLEPIVEFYDRKNVFDYLAILYHRKRGYLDGYWTYLKELEAAGKIKILKKRRIPIGNQFHEAYSVISWRPL